MRAITIYRQLRQLPTASGPSYFCRNSRPMCDGPHLRVTVAKLLSRRTIIPCLVALIVLTTGTTQSLPPLSHEQSATVTHGHRDSGPSFENLDLSCEVFPASAPAFHEIANPHSPKTLVTFLDETPVDSREHNRPPPNA